ncbi:MAG: hypothetical protein ACRERE_44035 [Candidatus Entotheonellia bacterium]
MRDPDREAVQARLEALGFTVDVISEEDDANRPDLVAIKEGVRMFVEVKARVEDSALRANMESVRAGSTEIVLNSLDKRNSLSSRIKQACRQLTAVAGPDDFRLLWFRAEDGPFVHGTRDQIGATLLGIRMVLVESAGRKRERACVYAGHADFHRFRDIDGTMIEVGEPIILILNQFSPRAPAFAASPICKIVGSAVFDVTKAPQNDPFYVVDGEVDRKSDDALLRLLRDKYPEDSFISFLEHHAGTVITTIDARSSGGV